METTGDYVVVATGERRKTVSKILEPGTTIKDRLGDTVVFRSYNIAILLQIRDKLDQLIKAVEGTPTEVVLSQEEFERATIEFGTTD